MAHDMLNAATKRSLSADAAMGCDASGDLSEAVECDVWTWIADFLTVPNDFYHGKFAPCPYARGAVKDGAVDVVAWRSGNLRDFIRVQAEDMRDASHLTTRVMVFPPRIQFTWGLSDYIESLNMALVSGDVFLNTGVAKETVSRYPNSKNAPYFIVVANSLDAVLKGADALQRTRYYENWPSVHFDLVVERRAKFAARYGKKTE